MLAALAVALAAGPGRAQQEAPPPGAAQPAPEAPGTGQPAPGEPGALPEQPAGRTMVRDIAVEGAEAVEPGLILSNLASKVGEPLSPQNVTTDIKTIYELGYFTDVRAVVEELEGGGVRLVYAVEEKPRIAYVDVEGVALLSRQTLDKQLTVKAGNFYSPNAVDRTVSNLRQAYRKEGYFTVHIRSQIDKRSEKRYGLRIIVEETPRVYVTDIRTHDNEVFSQLEIRRMMQTAEVDCFDWVNDSGVLDTEKINNDLRVISSRYLQNGYIRLFIERPEVTIYHNPEYSRVRVDLTFQEGEQYFTGEVDITGDILGDKQRLMNVLRLEQGAVYNPFDQNQDVFNLSQIYQEQGYAFVRVQPRTEIDDETHTVDVTYDITQGEKAYIGRIEIQGNRETRDYVIRREFEIRENELYDGRSLRRSQQNIRRLGYFKPSLQVETERTGVSNVVDVVTKVEETQTGTFQAQIGYSEQTRLSTAVSLSKGNLFGRGQTLRLRAEAGQRGIRQNYSVDFIEPHLFGSEYSSDSAVQYRELQDLTEQERGDFTELRVSQGFGYPFFRVFELGLTVEGINRDFERGTADDEILRSITPSVSYDTVDHPIFPTTGTDATLSMSQVGGQVLGGTTEYRRYRLRLEKFVSLNETSTLILMSRARLGWLEQVGDNRIPSQDRFRLGGIRTLRGYDFLDVGGPFGRLERELNQINVPLLDENGDPVLDEDGDPIITQADQRTIGLSERELSRLRGGGIFERLFNVELLFPLTGENMRGVVFYDAGQVNAEREQYEILGEKEPEFFDLLQSVGVGVRLITPLGVFRFEYGRKLIVRKGETPDKFDFTISTLF